MISAQVLFSLKPIDVYKIISPVVVCASLLLFLTFFVRQLRIVYFWVIHRLRIDRLKGRTSFAHQYYLTIELKKKVYTRGRISFAHRLFTCAKISNFNHKIQFSNIV